MNKLPTDNITCDMCHRYWLGKLFGVKPQNLCNQCQAALDTHDCHAGSEDGCACQELVVAYADDFRAKEIDYVK